MYNHILIPTDGSELAEKAVVAGTEYARETGAKVVLFTALPEYQPPSEAALMARHHVVSIFEYERQAEQQAKDVLQKAVALAQDAHVDFETDYALADQPYEAIIEAARKHQCDAIFMASHGRAGLPGLWHGSQTREVLTHSDIPTLVYR